MIHTIGCEVELEVGRRGYLHHGMLHSGRSFELYCEHGWQ